MPRGSDAPAGRKRMIREISYGLLVAAVFFILIELGLRLIAPLPDQPDQRRGLDIFILDLLWLPDPFTSTERGRRIAHYPFVDKTLVKKTKPENTLRIISMGGSVTQGWGFEPAFAYPRRLEQILNEKHNLPFKVEVLNAGNLGGNSYSGLFYFDNILKDYRPDILTIQFVVNDASPSMSIGMLMTDRQYIMTHRMIQKSPFLKNTHAFLRDLEIYSRIHRGLLDTSRRLSKPGAVIDPRKSRLPTRVPPDDYRQAISGYLDRAEQNDFETVMLFEGSNYLDYSLGPTDFSQPYWDILHELAQKRNAVLLTPCRILSQQDQPRKSYFIDGCHMNEDGLELFAERLADGLVESGALDRAAARIGAEK